MISFDTAWSDLQEEHGSFVFNLDNEPPIGGFLIPVEGAEEAVPFDVLTKSMLVSYVERHLDDATGNYVMGWHPDEFVYLDVVEWMATESDAVARAKDQGQPAVIDVTTGDVIET